MKFKKEALRLVNLNHPNLVNVYELFQENGTAYFVIDYIDGESMPPAIIHITDILPDDYFYMCSDGMLEQMGNNELEALFSSDSSDEAKCKQLIAATASNQDNHSAWLLHIKEAVSEPGDEQLENEGPTSCCNAINILPQAFDDDVEIASDDDDVVVVSMPTSPKKIENHS